MISKIFDLRKNINHNFYLFHGQNIGQKNEIIEQYFNPKFSKNIYSYYEKDVLSNLEEFNNQILSRSFFDDKKLIIIKDATDKIKETVEEIFEKKIDDVTIILVSNILEKKSKLRNFFEKNKNLLSVAFYSDNDLTLNRIAKSFFSERKIGISQETLNLLINRSSGDRKNLSNELLKIESFLFGKKTISLKELYLLTNLSENFNISELVDNCLAKNQKKIINIINENNFSFEDTIIIIRTFLIKSKRLLKLVNDYELNQNLESVVSIHKPPIFWKEKDLVKKQIKNWTINNTLNLINDLNKIEILIKKNSQNALNILFDFIINTSKPNNSI